MVATLGKEKPIGDLATGWRAALAAEADLAQVELGPALAELLVVKEDKEVSCVKRAAIFSAVVMQKSLVKRIEDCIEEDKKEKHSILADETEKAFEDPAKLGVKLAADLLESCYTPIIQSGGVFDLKPSAQSSDEKLHYGTITCSLGARYKSYCANVGRTLIINPSKAQERNYKLLLELQQVPPPARRPPPPAARRPPPAASRQPLSHRLLLLLPQAALDAMRADAKLSSVHEAVVNRLKSKAPHLESKLTRNCGFATGLEFKEGAYVLNAKSEQRLRPGMAFNLALGLEKLEEKDSADAKGKTCAAPRPSIPRSPSPAAPPAPPPPTHPPLTPPPPPPRSYALFLADTVLITESGAPELLTERAPKAWADINYQLNDEEGDEDAGGASSSKGGRMGKVEIKESRTRNAGHGVNKHAETNEHLAAHQEELEDQMRTDALKRLQEHGDPTAGTSGARETALAYRDPNAYPTATTSGVLKLNQTHVDGKAETVLVPVNGRLVPFHIATIKNVVKHEHEGWMSLRIQFVAPGVTASFASQQAALPAEADEQSHFIREITLKAKVATNLNNTFRLIKELRKRVQARHKQDSNTEGAPHPTHPHIPTHPAPPPPSAGAPQAGGPRGRPRRPGGAPADPDGEGAPAARRQHPADARRQEGAGHPRAPRQRPALPVGARREARFDLREHQARLLPGARLGSRPNTSRLHIPPPHPASASRLSPRRLTPLLLPLALPSRRRRRRSS